MVCHGPGVTGLDSSELRLREPDPEADIGRIAEGAEGLSRHRDLSGVQQQTVDHSRPRGPDFQFRKVSRQCGFLLLRLTDQLAGAFEGLGRWASFQEGDLGLLLGDLGSQDGDFFGAGARFQELQALIGEPPLIGRPGPAQLDLLQLLSGDDPRCGEVPGAGRFPFRLVKDRSCEVGFGPGEGAFFSATPGFQQAESRLGGCQRRPGLRDFLRTCSGFQFRQGRLGLGPLSGQHGFLGCESRLCKRDHKASRSNRIPLCNGVGRDSSADPRRECQAGDFDGTGEAEIGRMAGLAPDEGCEQPEEGSENDVAARSHSALGDDSASIGRVLRYCQDCMGRCIIGSTQKPWDFRLIVFDGRPFVGTADVARVNPWVMGTQVWKSRPVAVVPRRSLQWTPCLM